MIFEKELDVREGIMRIDVEARLRICPLLVFKAILN